MDTQIEYNTKVVRQFAVMTIVWGVIGMLVGVIIAAQLVWPALNFDVPWLTFSRLRPLHTNAVVFAFGGSALFATSYYVVQRTCQARLISDKLAAFTFWGWQFVIVMAVINGFESELERRILSVSPDARLFGYDGRAEAPVDNWPNAFS